MTDRLQRAEELLREALVFIENRPVNKRTVRRIRAYLDEPQGELEYQYRITGKYHTELPVVDIQAARTWGEWYLNRRFPAPRVERAQVGPWEVVDD